MKNQLRNFKAEFFKALAHPLRIEIIDALREGELTVNEISSQFGIESANASQQLAVLRNKNIIYARKEGSSVFYNVTDKTVFRLLDITKELFVNHLVEVSDMLKEVDSSKTSKKVKNL